MSKNISIEQFYDRFAQQYDDFLNNSEHTVRYYDEVTKIFKRYEYMQGSILDVGCGTGILREFLEGDFEYTGIDISKNMLQSALQRGYKVLHGSIEESLAEIDDLSHDFVVALGSLLFVENIENILLNLNRIASTAVILSIDDVTNELLEKIPLQAYNHSNFVFKNAKEDYRILGWISPSTGIPVKTRIVHLMQ